MKLANKLKPEEPETGPVSALFCTDVSKQNKRSFWYKVDFTVINVEMKFWNIRSALINTHKKISANYRDDICPTMCQPSVHTQI